MTKISITKLGLAAALLVAGVALSACSGGDTPAEHSAADRAEGHTSSSAGLPPGRVAEGEKLATACAACHGAQGNAPLDASYPKLGGQYYDYIAHSLQMYRDGQRSGSPTADVMAAQAKNLTDQQIADLAAYFGAQPTQLRDLHGAQ